MYHLGSLTYSGEIMFNMETITSLTNFHYNIKLIPETISQIYMKPISEQNDDENPQFNMEIPTGQHSIESLINKQIFILLLLYSKSITLEPKTKYRNLLTEVLQEWDIDYQLKKKSSYLKILLSGTTSVSYLDFESFPSLLTAFNRKTLSEVKIYNSYVFAKNYFQEKLLNKLYEGDNIDEQFDSAMLQIKLMYRQLTASQRFGYKSKEFSFQKLSRQIQDMLLSGNNSSSAESSIHDAIQEALTNLFEEQYSLELEDASEIDKEFFLRVVNNYVSMVSTDEKVMVCVKIILQKIFEECCPSRGKHVTNYKLNKKLKQINNLISQKQREHKREKEKLFSIVYEKQNQIKELNEKLRVASEQIQVNKINLQQKDKKLKEIKNVQEPAKKVKTQYKVNISENNFMKDQPKGIKSENSSKLISQRSTKDLYHVPKKENFKKKKTDSNNTTIKKLDKQVKKKEDKRVTLGPKNTKI